MTIWTMLRLWIIKKLGGVPRPENGFVYIVRRKEEEDA